MARKKSVRRENGRGTIEITKGFLCEPQDYGNLALFVDGVQMWKDTLQKNEKSFMR